VEGIHLPWQTKLSESGGKVVDTIENSGAGEPGWKTRCLAINGEKETDECTSESAEKLESANLENKMTGSELLVLATFAKAHKAKCSKGGKEEGEIEGQGAILLATGVGLRVS
jgi:hypothetical protein